MCRYHCTYEAGVCLTPFWHWPLHWHWHSVDTVIMLTLSLCWNLKLTLRCHWHRVNADITCYLSETTRHYVQMFESIQRLGQMHRYYEHFHKSLLGKSWTELTEISDKSLPQSLALFYDTIVSTFHSQVSSKRLPVLPLYCPIHCHCPNLVTEHLWVRMV